MANTFQERLLGTLSTYWHGSYRTPVILSSCTALLLTPYAWKKLTYKPKSLPPPPKDFDYRLAKIAKTGSSVLTLPDGRKIGYAQYGDPNGKPIICLHGMLGSRLENVLMDSDAKALGARIIGIERPGIGRSSPDPRPISQRKVVDHAQDVEAVAEHLGLGEYAVLGTSGGGPYALACAATLPTTPSPSKPRLKAVSIVTGLGLPDMSQPFPAPLVWLNKTFDLRWLMKYLFTAGPVWNLTLSDEERQAAMCRSFDVKKALPADVEMTRHPDYSDWQRVFLLSTREALAQGLAGFEDDAYVLSRDPGFRAEEIRADLPMQLWYGTADTNIGLKVGEEIAERLRKAGNLRVELHVEEGETHGSTQVKFRRAYLGDLLGVMGG